MSQYSQVPLYFFVTMLFTYREFSKNDTKYYYLTYIDVENGYEARFVGEFDEADLPEEPEQHEDYDPEDPECNVDYIPWID